MKIAFLHGQNSDYFLRGMADVLAERHEIRVSPATTPQEIQDMLAWADVAWLEWAGAHAVTASRCPGLCPLVCRLHSYECFTDTPVVWENISKLLFVSPAIEQIFAARGLKVPHEIMLNAVDAAQFPLRASVQRTGRIGCLSLAMNACKNLPYALQMFLALWKDDPSLTLHLTGQPRATVEELRIFVYLKYMVASLGLEKRVFFEGNVPRERVNDWLEDKDCLLSASVFESFGSNIAEAMCKGIKPIINNFWGASFFFPPKYIATTLDDVRRIYAAPARPEDLRAFIEERYSVRRLAAHAERVLTEACERGCPQNKVVVKDYWQERYAQGGTSGSGSYGRLAEFKAEFMNAFVEEQGIHSVLELGCGDGNQLMLARYPRYIGYDIAPKAIDICRKKFAADASKQFLVYEHQNFQKNLRGAKADMALSLDVIFHLVEEHIFNAYMEDLFAAARRYVVIYSSDFAAHSDSRHEQRRQFSAWIREHAPQWECVRTVKNRYPYDPENTDETSLSDFFVYQRKGV